MSNWLERRIRGQPRRGFWRYRCRGWDMNSMHKAIKGLLPGQSRQSCAHWSWSWVLLWGIDWLVWPSWVMVVARENMGRRSSASLQTPKNFWSLLRTTVWQKPVAQLDFHDSRCNFFGISVLYGFHRGKASHATACNQVSPNHQSLNAFLQNMHQWITPRKALRLESYTRALKICFWWGWKERNLDRHRTFAWYTSQAQVWRCVNNIATV